MVPGYAVHQELKRLVAAGLSPYEALKTGTVNVAAWLEESSTAGTIEVGKRADFVLLGSNPLVDITNASSIEGVFTHGEYHSRATLTHCWKRRNRRPRIDGILRSRCGALSSHPRAADNENEASNSIPRSRRIDRSVARILVAVYHKASTLTNLAYQKGKTEIWTLDVFSKLAIRLNAANDCFGLLLFSVPQL